MATEHPHLYYFFPVLMPLDLMLNGRVWIPMVCNKYELLPSAGSNVFRLSWKGCKPQDGGAMLQPASSVTYQAWTARAYFNLLRIFTHTHTYVYTLYLCMYIYIYIYRYLSIYLSVYLSIYLSVCGSNCSRVPIVPDSLCNLCMVNMWRRTTKYDNNTNNTQKKT